MKWEANNRLQSKVQANGPQSFTTWENTFFLEFIRRITPRKNFPIQMKIHFGASPGTLFTPSEAKNLKSIRFIPPLFDLHRPHFPNSHEKHVGHSAGMILGKVSGLSFKKLIQCGIPQLQPRAEMRLFDLVIYCSIHLPMDFSRIESPGSRAGLKQNHLPKIS
jgi:hypothetical protein